MQLTLTDITVRFGDRTVLNRLIATFSAGEVIAVMGPSGSGKSTLLGVIAGAVIPDSGVIACPGRDKVEWLVQSTPLLQRRSVLANTELSALIRGVEQTIARHRALRALRAVGIGALARKQTYTLSGGEKQRVAIARAMASEATMILADEPTASLDPEMRERVCEALIAAARAGAIVIVATHDEFVAARCDGTFRLQRGLLVRDAP